MSQPKGDHGDVYPTMQQVHGRGVSEGVRRHFLSPQGGASFPSDVPGH